MRLLPALFAALVCASAASAQEKPTEPAPAPVAVPVPAAAPEAQNASPPEDAKPSHRAHLSWEQRFAQANATHDGHLTLEQAKGGYTTVARHFHDIDLDGKGYVTEEDVRTWHKTQRAARHSGQSRESDPLQPRPAFQRMFPQNLQFNTSSDRTIPRTEHAPDSMPSVEATPAPELSSDKSAAPF